MNVIGLFKTAHEFMTRDYFTSPLQKLEKKIDVRFGLYFGVTGLFGQYMKYHPHDGFPRVLRWHLSNSMDLLVFGSMFNLFLIAGTGRSRPLLAAAITLGIGLTWECWEATRPHHSFDVVDTACYFAGAAAYVTARKILSAHRARNLTQNTTQAPVPPPP